MSLKQWNKLQAELFCEFHIKDITLIYRVASALAMLKKLSLCEETVCKAKDIVRKELGLTS